MMQLFQPNNLSRDRPEFVPIDDSPLFEEIKSLLAQFYGISDLQDLAIERFAGTNISSQNLRVTTSVNKWFLKVREAQRQQEMSNEVTLNYELFALGQRVPEVIPATDGALISTRWDKCWALYRFHDGRYFSGQDTELQSAAKAFGRLTRAAKELPRFSDRGVDPREFEFLDDLEELVKLANSRESPLAEVCSTNSPTILKCLRSVKDSIQLLSEQWLPLHLDYHPLNLLTIDGEVECILDLEHLKMYSALAGSGFAAYKLIRQAMVNETFRASEFKSPSAVAHWQAGTTESLPELSYMATELAVGASFRILKLIHLILHSSLRNDDHRHDYDLAKQVYSLSEVEIVFERSLN